MNLRRCLVLLALGLIDGELCDWWHVERNVLFWNRGDERFAEVAYAAGVNRIEDGRALAIADLDRDGRLDLVLNNFDRAARILMSRGPDRAGLLVELEGTRSSRDGVGAEVRVHAPGARQSYAAGWKSWS